VAGGKTLPQAEKSLNEQIEKVLKNGVTEAELDKAKNRFLTGKLMERETNNGKANALGEAVVMYHDPDHINTDLAKYQAVTAKQVKDVLNKYLDGKKRVLIEYLPEANKEAAKPQETEKPSSSDETP
jgi:zinc protease